MTRYQAFTSLQHPLRAYRWRAVYPTRVQRCVGEKQKSWLHKGWRRCFSKQADPPNLIRGKRIASWTFWSSNFQCSNDNSLFGSLCGTREIGHIGMAEAPLSICSGVQKELFRAFQSKKEDLLSFKR